MKKLQNIPFSLLAAMILLLWMPAITAAQSGPPPVGGPLVGEGDFAVRLMSTRNLGSAEDDRSRNPSGDVGIIPRNGWIADYPVTPDILGELQRSVVDAASSRKIQLSREEALKRVNAVNDEYQLSANPYTVVRHTAPNLPPRNMPLRRTSTTITLKKALPCTPITPRRRIIITCMSGSPIRSGAGVSGFLDFSTA